MFYPTMDDETPCILGTKTVNQGTFDNEVEYY